MNTNDNSVVRRFTGIVNPHSPTATLETPVSLSGAIAVPAAPGNGNGRLLGDYQWMTVRPILGPTGLTIPAKQGCTNANDFADMWTQVNLASGLSLAAMRGATIQ
jgi:hypothetical protein